jgi:general secretion pathway protein G
MVMRRTPASSSARGARRRARGFTLIEMVVVMATIALLLSIALPRYMATLERGKEQVLRQNLIQMREAIDKYYGDRGRYPDKLEDLVTQRYLRAIPNDPFTESPTWIVVAPRDGDKGGVIDVQSTMTDIDGQPRRAAGSPAGTAADALPNVVTRESGSSSVVTAVGMAASAADTGAAR